MSNIIYHSDQIARYYQDHRVQWKHFYQSERYIFELLAERYGPPRQVLDAGCAVGGLGSALQERFGTIEQYTGVDVNRQAIALAQSRAEAWQRFMCGDVAAMDFSPTTFQWVVSLSCADWNLDPVTTIRRLWERVAPGGVLILSLRLSNRPGTYTPNESYQRIDFFSEGGPSSEVANYVVFNIMDAIRLLAELKPVSISGYGYWGPPSQTAITPYDLLVFAVFATQKPDGARRSSSPLTLELLIPSDLLSGLQSEGSTGPPVLS